MKVKVTDTGLPGLLLVEIEPFRDERGFFVESYHRREFAAAGLDLEFVQDNHSRSARGVLRGLHYQDLRTPMAKLVRCTQGSLFDVAVDLRVGSPTFGQWHGLELSETNQRQLFVPVGFAHGFVVLSESADLQYKCSNYYDASAEGAIAWNDPALGIAWPIATPLVSKRDQAAMRWDAYLTNPAFTYAGPGAA